MKKMTTAISAGALAAVLAVTMAVTPASAGPLLTAERMGAWAQPSTYPDQFARTIQDIAIIGQEAYAGWGDYDKNIGPVQLSSVNVTTGGNTPRFTLNGEEADALRVYGGKLYVPDVDPKQPWSAPAGYATSAPKWRYVAALAAQHVFDVAELNGELFIAGSMTNPDPATYGPTADLAFIAQSKDAGVTWQVVRWKATDPAVGHSGYDRYYWLAVANGKVWASARIYSGKSSLDVYSNGVWAEVATPYGIQNLNTQTHLVQAFGTRVVGNSAGNEVWVIDGTVDLSAGSIPAPARVRIGENRSVTIMDFAVDAPTGTVYALLRNDAGVNSDDDVWRSTDGITWTHVATVNIPVPNWFVTWHNGEITTEFRATATALAVRNGDLFLGTNMGDLWRIRNGAR